MKKKVGRLEIILLMAIFLGFVPLTFFVYWGITSLNIYINKDNYKAGYLIIDSLDCGHGNGGDDFNCYGNGKVNSTIKTVVKLGKTPGVNALFGEYADLEKKEYEVFYREDGKHTLLRNQYQTKFDGSGYIWSVILNFLYPLVIYPAIIVKYKQVKKNNLKNKVWERE